MHIAKSMYMGGIVVYADDDFLTDSSYFELGLLCLGCDNDVIIRGGKKNRKHFSHRKASSEQEKSCAYRASAFNSSIGGDFTEAARSQRRTIFQLYLMQFIASSHRDFYVVLRNGDSLELEALIEECVIYYHKIKSDYIAQCRSLRNMSFSPNKIASALVSGEVFSYLGSDSGKSALEKILLYSIKRLKNETNTENFDRSSFSIQVICERLRNVIANTSWDLIYNHVSEDYVINALRLRLGQYISSGKDAKESSFPSQESQKKRRKQRRKKNNSKNSASTPYVLIGKQEYVSKGNRNKDEKSMKRERRLAFKKEKMRIIDSIKREIVENLKTEGITSEKFEQEEICNIYQNRYTGLISNGYPFVCPDCGKRVDSNFYEHVKNHSQKVTNKIVKKIKRFSSHISQLAEQEFQRRVKLGIATMNSDGL